MNHPNTAVVVGAQWGDEGKGKIVDVLSSRFSVVARYAGGHNAGHTVTINGKRFVLQLVPCGILREGCRAVIGNGVVLDPFALLKEVDALRAAGVRVDGNLFISNRAQVILPYHRMIELAAENAPGRVKIGTTSRGIGPAYEDKMGRRGLRVADLLDLELLKKHIENACREKNMIAHALFNSEPLDAEEMFREYARASKQIAPFVCDTAALLNQAIAHGEAVMFEGAQGTMLDIDHGTYPFVTSSSATSGGAVIGTGVGPTSIGTVIGVTKAYCTRVGEGPVSHRTARCHGRRDPQERQRIRRGHGTSAALRMARPAAAALLGDDQRHRVAGGHQAGRAGRARRNSGVRRLQDQRQEDVGDSGASFRVRQDRVRVPDAAGLAQVHRGHHRRVDKLPAKARDYLAFIEKESGAKVGMISTGPGREQTIITAEFAAELDKLRPKAKAELLAVSSPRFAELVAAAQPPICLPSTRAI